jgi:hypothetical protein
MALRNSNATRTLFCQKNRMTPNGIIWDHSGSFFPDQKCPSIISRVPHRHRRRSGKVEKSCERLLKCFRPTLIAHLQWVD